MGIFLSVLPLALLIFFITFRRGLPAHYALPIVAVIMYLLQLLYFKPNINDIHASILSGALTTATPILILWGAILLFNTMETIGSLSLIRVWLNGLSRNPIAQIMLVGWAFSFFIEGISGFGTPAVLAAPLLVGFGFNPIRVIAFCLILNTIPVSFGAVGTPVWFGLGELNLSQETLRSIAVKTTLIQGAVALIIPIAALRLLADWKSIHGNIVFIYISVLSTVIPYIITSLFSVEFPSIVGGLIGLITTAFCSYKKIGLDSRSVNRQVEPDHSLSKKDYFRAFAPLGGCIAFLLITRIPAFKLRGWLNSGSIILDHNWVGLGHFKLSSSAVFHLSEIFGTSISWKHPLLFIPSIFPFAVICLACILIFRVSADKSVKLILLTTERIRSPLLAMFGAMIFVKLFMLGGVNAPTTQLGIFISYIAGGAWNFASVYLGALGSFFGGSCTLSNLTFAPIQSSVAAQIQMSQTLALSLQMTGGAMGNMICIHNIVAVCAVLGLNNQEGKIFKMTVGFAVFYGLLAGLVSLALN